MENNGQPEKKPNVVRIVLFGIINVGGMSAIALISAGRWDYWPAWYYMGLNIFIMIVNLVFQNRELTKERIKPGQGVKGWDRIYFFVSTVMFIIALVVGGLDSGRYGWSGKVPPAVPVIGIALMVTGYVIFHWAKFTNRFFSSVVRIQTERNHEVCQEGPYRIVRHPGYVGGLIANIGIPLVFSSYWMFIPTFVGIVLVIVRTALEDETLKAELPGYKEYAQKVKYRLLPGIW